MIARVTLIWAAVEVLQTLLLRQREQLRDNKIRRTIEYIIDTRGVAWLVGGKWCVIYAIRFQFVRMRAGIIAAICTQEGPVVRFASWNGIAACQIVHGAVGP